MTTKKHDITHKEQLWLQSRGGRSLKDVYADDKGKYVIMFNGYEKVDVKVYIPHPDLIRVGRGADGYVRLY